MSEKKHSIGAVSRRLDLAQSVLRYWESVFVNLNPEKTPGGTRKYSESDVALILKIKNLLYERKFTIAGAQAYLKEEASITLSKEENEFSRYIIDELEDIIKILQK